MTVVAEPQRAGVRAYTGPQWRCALRQSGTRAGLMGGAAGTLAVLQSMHPDQSLVVCPLRALTGIPCPLCGGTTAAISVARLDPLGALLANPVVVVGALLFVLVPFGLMSRVRELPRRLRILALLAALVVAELWQLVRYDVLPI